MGLERKVKPHVTWAAMAWQRYLLAALWLLSAFPAVHTAYLSETRTVSYPLWDEWVLVGKYLAKSAQGTPLKLADYLESYVHSRSPIPKFLCISLARMSGWDVKWGTRLTLALTALSFLSLAWLISRQTFLSPWEKPLYSLATAALLFNPMQQTPWYFSAMASNALALAPVVLGTVLWSTRLRFSVKLGLALTLTLISSLSMVTGLVLWLVTPLLMWWTRPEPHSRRVLVWCTIGWVAVFGLFGIFYFAGLEASQRSLGLSEALGRWAEIVDFVLALLGFPVSFLSSRHPMYHLRTVSVVMANGFIFTLLAVLALNLKFVFSREGFRQLLPWFILIFLGLGFSLMVALNRLDIRNSEFVTRYAAYAGFFYMGWILVVRLCFGRCLQGWRAISPGRALFTWLTSVVLAVVLGAGSVSFVKSYRKGVEKAEDVYYNARKSRGAIQFSQVCPDLELLNQAAWTNAERIIEYAPPIAAAGYLKPGLVKSTSITDNHVVAEGHGCYQGQLDRIKSQGRAAFMVYGWALNTAARQPSDLVVLTAKSPSGEEKVVSIAMETVRRGDLRKRFGEIAHNARCGWQIFVGKDRLPLGNSVLRAYAFDTDSLEFHRLPGEKSAFNDGTTNPADSAHVRAALRQPPALGEELP